MATNPPRPLGRNVILIEKKETVELTGDNGFSMEGTMTAGGIFIPAAVNETRDKMALNSTKRAIVLAIGSEVEEVEEGDEVIYNMHAVKEMEIDDQMYLVVNVHDIWAVITTDDSTGS